MQMFYFTVLCLPCFFGPEHALLLLCWPPSNYTLKQKKTRIESTINCFAGGYIHICVGRPLIFVCFNTCLFCLWHTSKRKLTLFIFHECVLFPACTFICVYVSHDSIMTRLESFHLSSTDVLIQRAERT